MRKTINDLELNYDSFYYCYDKSESTFFKQKGISYLFKARSIKDSHIFTLYLRTAELYKVKDEYDTLKLNEKE